MAVNPELETATAVKANVEEIKMQKDNELMLGYANTEDLFSSVFGLKLFIINIFGALAASTTTFITDYIWDDATAIYMLLGLILADAVSGIIKSIKNKKFSSARLPRILVIAVVYTALLAIAWNVSKYSPFYSWLPPFLYGGFVTTLLVSIFENLNSIGLLPKSIYDHFIKKMKHLQVFLFGEAFYKNKKKK
jgi:toxin secretion/phage lysis holin